MTFFALMSHLCSLSIRDPIVLRLMLPEFTNAIKIGKITYAKELLQRQGKEVSNERDEDNVTPAHWASLVRFVNVL